MDGERYAEIVKQAQALGISAGRYVELAHESYREGKRLIPYMVRMRKNAVSRAGYRSTRTLPIFSDSFANAYKRVLQDYPDHEVVYIEAFDVASPSVVLADGSIGVFVKVITKLGAMNRLSIVRLRNVNRTTRAYTKGRSNERVPPAE